MRTRIVGFVVLALGVAVLAACNTMQGLDKDIETLGDKIQRKSSR